MEAVETYRAIKGFEGLYEVSNQGNVRSLDREVRNPHNSYRTVRGRQLKLKLNMRGYYIVGLSNSNVKYRTVHTLVWDAFGRSKRDGNKIQVDHIDANKLNNNITNLQLLTARANMSKMFQQKGKLLPVGVYYNKSRRKFGSQIRIKNIINTLGFFDNPVEASKVYQQALNQL